MIITKSKLIQIIKEELKRVLGEGPEYDMPLTAFATMVKGNKSEPDEPAYALLPRDFEAAKAGATKLLKAFKEAEGWRHKNPAGVEKVNQETSEFIDRSASNIRYLLQATSAIASKPTESVGKFMAFAPGVQQRLKIIIAALTEINNYFEHAKNSIAKSDARAALIWLSERALGGAQVDGEALEKLSESKALKRIIQAAQEIGGSLDEFASQQGGEEAEQPAAEV